MVRPGDVVMVKSSNGIGLSRIVDALVKKFPAAASNSHAA
jgi:UDP-N-acetylmuramoyl-tripeptide--D-alanyl-D-alanine ligase